MTTETTAGTTLKISAGVPSTFDSTGYAALTYTQVGEVVNLGDFGRVYNLVKHNPIDTRGTTKKKGSYDEGSVALQLGLDDNDAGQTLMKAARASDSAYAFKVTAQSGHIYYFQAIVLGFKVNFGTVDQIKGASANLEITTSSTGVGIVEV